MTLTKDYKLLVYNLCSNNNNTDVCDNDSASLVDKNYIYYILITIYVLCTILSIIVTLVAVDHYAVDTKVTSCKEMLKVYLLQPIVDIIVLSVNWKCVLLTPMSFTNGYMIGLSLSIYTKVCA